MRSFFSFVQKFNEFIFFSSAGSSGAQKFFSFLYDFIRVSRAFFLRSSFSRSSICAVREENFDNGVEEYAVFVDNGAVSVS